jgi:CHAT domain-containing protein/Tfp pilus assembly protein PilF
LPLWFPLLAAVLCCAALAAAAGCGRGRVEQRRPAPRSARVQRRAAPATPARRPFQLGRGAGVERPLGPGEVDSCDILLAAGDYLYLTVDQRQVDVAVDLFAPGGNALFSVDGPYGAQGEEKVHLLADLAGRYRFDIHASPAGGTGAYRARIVILRPATAADRRRAAAERAFFEARGWRGRKPAYWEQTAKFEQALRLFHGLGAKEREAESYYRLGMLRLDERDYGEALDLFESANALYWRVADGKFIALSYNQIGRCQIGLGDLGQAAAAYRRALAAWLRRPPEEGRVVTLENLAELHAVRGETAEALRAYRQAADLARQLGKEAREAVVLKQLGWVYRSVGEPGPALAVLREALAICLRACPGQRAAILNEMGNVYLDGEQAARARGLFEQAWKLDAEAGDSDVRAATLTGLGISYRRLGQFAQALAVYGRARDIYHAAGDRRGEANAWLNLGSAYSHMEQPARAAECYGRALELAHVSGYLATEAAARLGRGGAARDRGQLLAALQDGEQALEMVETLRGGAERADLQAAFLAANEDRYGFLIDLLMQLHKKQPASGFDRRALLYSERSRARRLLDALLTRQALAHVAGALAPSLLGERREVERRIAETDRQLRAPVKLAEAPAPVLESQLSALIERAREIDERIRRSDSSTQDRRAALPHPVGGLRQDVLDEQTLLLEYFVGAHRSFLWAVTPTSVDSFELPSGDRLEPLVRAAYDALAKSQAADARAAAAASAAELSRILLGPVAGRLGGRRLLIVANGVLQLVSFAALPDPAEGAEPLMTRHEIVYAPSLAVLGELRAAPRRRSHPAGPIAIIADPVFGNLDERARRFHIPAASLDPLVARLARLEDSRLEAAAIKALAGEGALMALGFDANAELVRSGRLARYPVLHLATHGLLRGDQPDLSGLALSQIDGGGRVRDGFLRELEIEALDLPSDLVVLSACKTALGKRLGGEVVGLPLAFMSAGARRVVVSLWDVGDRSTAELMRHFYRGLLVRKLSPAAALRAAQQALRRSARSRAPSHWGAFVFQGDWR